MTNKLLYAAVLSEHSREIFSICPETSLIFLLKFLNSLIITSLNTPLRKKKSPFTLVYTVNNFDRICVPPDGDLWQALVNMVMHFLAYYLSKQDLNNRNSDPRNYFSDPIFNIAFLCKRKLWMGTNLSNHDNTVYFHFLPIVVQSPGE